MTHLGLIQFSTLRDRPFDLQVILEWNFEISNITAFFNYSSASGTDPDSSQKQKYFQKLFINIQTSKLSFRILRFIEQALGRHSSHSTLNYRIKP